MKGFDAMYRVGGMFVALLRNPIQVVNSQFLIKLQTVGQDKEDFDRDYVARMPYAHLVNSREDALFARCAGQGLLHYFECGSVDRDFVFLFEHYTIDYAEIMRLVGVLTQGQIVADSDIERAFYSLGKVNPHQQAPATWEEVFFSHWTDRHREIFSFIYNHLNGLLLKPTLPIRYPFIHDLVMSC